MRRADKHRSTDRAQSCRVFVIGTTAAQLNVGQGFHYEVRACGRGTFTRQNCIAMLALWYGNGNDCSPTKKREGVDIVCKIHIGLQRGTKISADWLPPVSTSQVRRDGAFMTSVKACTISFVLVSRTQLLVSQTRLLECPCEHVASFATFKQRSDVLREDVFYAASLPCSCCEARTSRVP